MAHLLDDGATALAELLGALPGAGLRAAAKLRNAVGVSSRPTPAVRRAARDTLAAEIVAVYFASRLGEAPPGDLIDETIDYLIELSGTRVEAHDLTHGVVFANVLHDTPLAGVGFYVRGDRSIWTFVDGQPLLVRRNEHWTALPVELAAAISNMIGGGPGAEIVARAAYMTSAGSQGAILAIVDDPAALDGVVSPKDLRPP